MNTRLLKLCLVTNFKNQLFNHYAHFIHQAIRGGVTSVQLREKFVDANECLWLARKLKKFLSCVDVPLIINDYVEIAKEVDAAGVHIGQSDMPPQEARALLGPDKIIGWSVETLEELEIANNLDCIDYIAASSVFHSKTKTNCKTIWGLDGLQYIARHSKHPVVGIGGITVSNVKSVIENGACGVAVIGAIHDHSPQQAAEALIAEIDMLEEKKRVLCWR